MRPFLLLQCRDEHDPMRDHEVECFLRAMGIGGTHLQIMSVLQGPPTDADLARCSAVLMGGAGDYSSLDREPWIDALIDFTAAELIGAGKPTFASCFGFQILVRATGGVMIRDPDNTEFGTYDLRLAPEATDDPLFGDLPEVFAAQVGHHDRAATLGPGVSRFASSPLCPVHALRVDGRPIWATQFHPELTIDDLHTRFAYYSHYASATGGEGWEPDLRPSEAASALLPRFVGWVRGYEAALAMTGARG